MTDQPHAPIPFFYEIPLLSSPEIDIAAKLQRAAELKDQLEKAEAELKELKVEIAADINMAKNEGALDGSSIRWGGYRFTWVEGGKNAPRLSKELLLKNGVPPKVIEASMTPGSDRSPSLTIARIKEAENAIQTTEQF
jgi:hypothetical protein